MLVAAPLSQSNLNLWWIALALGTVVVIVVIVLLSLLVSLVDDIDVRVADAWNTATRVAANTATTWMLDECAVLTNDLREEVMRHAQLLASLGG